MKKIFVLPRIDYKMVVSNLGETRILNSAFIQINEPFNHGKELFGGASDPIMVDTDNILNLWFDDAEENLPLLNGDKLRLFDEEMAATIVQFVRENEDKETWFIHCTAGISRSGAVGDVLSEYFEIPYSEFKQMNPRVQPNTLVKNLLRKKFFFS